jgi:fungalysin metallopeptidase (M36)/fungalysin/thermolysin propeptide
MLLDVKPLRRAPIVSLVLLALFVSTYRLPVAASLPMGEAETLSGFEPLPSFDLRNLRKPPAALAFVEQKKRSLAVAAAPATVVIRWDEQMDRPRHLFSYEAPLTAASDDDEVAIAKRFVRDNAAIFQIGEREMRSARVSARATDERAGFTRLALEQRVNGIRVFDAEMLFIIDRQGRVVSESGSFIPEIQSRAPAALPALSAESALARAALACGAQLTTPVSSFTEQLPARTRTLFSSDELDSRSEASLLYYPVTRQEVRLAYQVLLYGAPSAIDSYLVLVDARTGELLRRESLVFASDGRVFTRENPVVSGSRQMMPLAGDTSASPQGWVKATRTEGNNTQVFYNPQAEPNRGEMVEANSDGNFDFPLDLSQNRSPVESFKASATNLFYWVNFAHDRFHALGFNEASRNFQTDNFGKGGRGGDAIRAETLRGALVDPTSGGLVRNNAFFSSSLEGTQPLLAMLMWEVSVNGQLLRLDSSYDAGVVIHEFTHGVSTRLTGTDNSVGLGGSIQGRGMGEGWSDFFAMSFLSDSDRALDGAFPAGSYITQRTRGVRTYPYSTDFKVNPLTFGDIQFNNEVHAQGTVWCTILWDMRQSLIKKYGFDAGRQTAERLVVDGLKLTPRAPLFTDARDAILLADRTASGGANQDLIWQAFARRGLGASATTSLAVERTGFRLTAKEGYDVPVEVSAGSIVINDKPPAPAVLFEAIPVVVVDGDLTAQQSVEVRATNLRTGAQATFTLGATQAGRFAGSLRVLPPEADGGPGATVVAQPGDQIAVSYDNARSESGAAETIEARTVAGRRVTVMDVNFEQGSAGWTLQTLWHISERRSASASHSLYFAQQKGNKERKSFVPEDADGSAFSPQTPLSDMLRPRLEFDYIFIGAAGDSMFTPGDIMSLSASNLPFFGALLGVDESRLSVSFDVRPEADAVFRQANVDLRFIENRRAYLNFFFSASPATMKRKKLEGFYLDNVRVTAVRTQ